VPEEALAEFERALALQPDDAEATLHLGEALASLGRFDDSLGILQRAAALCPGDPRSYKLRGRVLDRLGRNEEAMAMHKQAREVSNP
jgi:Flp pilus assembly protein TadD